MFSIPARRLLLLAAALTTLALTITPGTALAANGCGPAGFGFVVPDHPLGFDFHAACNRHDDCYTTPWRAVAPSRFDAKLACDNGLLDDLDNGCVPETGRRLELCYALARDYYRAVRSWLGDLAYSRAQA
jgi:hypothetical protein